MVFVPPPPPRVPSGKKLLPSLDDNNVFKPSPSTNAKQKHRKPRRSSIGA
eukprot:CAMPEP_0197044156 /NCGR_PEP_ID=MMETSP1384-20130603/20279_1 /TAXON_ID=29189 /ORGANISM="Ammonia sp." /LENGTH=49 /DNA_ID= /DNA_START= /DNA_END= /DNA_ORIENTATION=